MEPSTDFRINMYITLRFWCKVIHNHLNMIRGVILDPYSDVANEMEKIGLGSSSDSSYDGPTWSWFINKVDIWQNNAWNGFSAEFLWGLYCRIKKV